MVLQSTRETLKKKQEICHTLDPQVVHVRLERRKRYRAKKSNMAQKVVGEKKEWEKYLLAEA